MFSKSVTKNVCPPLKHKNTRPLSITEYLLSLPRGLKRTVMFSADFAMSCVCLFLALSLRYGNIAHHISPAILFFYAAIPIIGLYTIGFYKGVARGFLDNVMGTVAQLFFVLIIIFEIIIYLNPLESIPRSVPIIFLFLYFIWLWNSRLIIRELLMRRWGQHRAHLRNEGSCDNIVIYGAGDAGRNLLKGLRNSHNYNVVAYVDDDHQLIGGYLLDKKIYAAHELEFVIRKYDVAQVFLALPSVNRTQKRKIIEKLSGISIKIQDLPSLKELADGKVTVSSMRKVDILDVLDRQTVEPNMHLLQKNISGKCVLVTGAGGSIGSELCRQVIKNQPKCLVLYESSEYALYSIHQELIAFQSKHNSYQTIDIIAVIGNVTNEDNLYRILTQHQIKTVYHAAAYKHVPLVEHNPFEGVINNTKGTYHCARAAIEANVETFVLISTDKAVRPTNVMGATKRLAELVCQGLSKTSNSTCISMVRFGNVLGSSGSVIPVFTKQIEEGKSITVTHPNVTRYFMTIPEASNLVIQAGAMATGGEVFVLDMGEPVKIVDLARRMIHLSGHETKTAENPDGDIEIVFTGLRPGEKLYEELIIGDDNVEGTDHPLIMQAMEHSFPLNDIENILFELTEKQKQHDVNWLKAQFRQFVDGYQECSQESSESV
ncbi:MULTISPECIES: polysaccharide biosynthesis protein [Psychrobacter]|uniref:Polysaccharide biosynthesis protein CapD n=1 Tax=Psychrobacter alimentarius TaxID=261164 RepID=A0ABN4N015_9GAMM|nr:MULTISPECIES: nucleoside-diphosphate sugar epimerase/dehydratase [Psychrobacter]AMT96339.1 Polysaccharide biosynthesis protein CapD [Psychrobacter alimentarius]QCB31264.1 polysaccharide biosynthesis protein [Psychrobacter sp. PAMC27889]